MTMSDVAIKFIAFTHDCSEEPNVAAAPTLRSLEEILSAAKQRGASFSTGIHAPSRSIERGPFGGAERERHYADPSDLVTVTSVALSFVSSAAFIAFLKYARDIIIQWMKNNASHHVHIKLDGSEISIRGTDDIDRAIDALKRIRGSVAAPSEQWPSFAPLSEPPRCPVVLQRRSGRVLGMVHPAYGQPVLPIFFYGGEFRADPVDA
jgi:hypothetical protein